MANKPSERKNKPKIGCDHDKCATPYCPMCGEVIAETEPIKELRHYVYKMSHKANKELLVHPGHQLRIDKAAKWNSWLKAITDLIERD